MMKKIIGFYSVLSILFLSCNHKNDLKILHYKTIYTAPKDSITSGLILQPGDSFNVSINFQKYDYRVKRKLRISGGSILPVPYQKRGEESFRKFLYTLDDYLDSTDVISQKYSLLFKGENDPFERNAYYRLSQHDFVRGSEAQFFMNVKASELSYISGELSLEIQFYFSKPGIHPDDIFHHPDSVKHFTIDTGTYSWKEFKNSFFIPANTACIIIKVGGKGFNGICKVEAPQCKQSGKNISIRSFDKYNLNDENWVGENLSQKEWPEFEISIDNNIFFSGKIFDRASDISDFEIELPLIENGNKNVRIALKEKYPSSLPYRILDIGLLESGMRDFEISYVPEYVFEDKEFSVLVEINKPGIALSFSSLGNIKPKEEKRIFNQPGLFAIQYQVLSMGENNAVVISDNNRKAIVHIKQILDKENDSILLSCGDDIYIDRNKNDFSDYLQWYMREGIGNSYFFRPSYQWSGTRNADKEFYAWASTLVQDLSMPYPLMVEGRSIPEKDVNPNDEFISSPLYLGRQAHENDGGFYYWRHFKYIGLYTDLFAQMRPQGGIFAKTPVKRNGKEISVFFDPKACKNMKEGAEMFVNNVRQAKGPSSRHTGPTTLFRYFFQAGYLWLGAEQMYGPEEVIMSSLRGACKAYGKTNYGTHLATQWGSGPYDDPAHAERLFLSLAVSYMHGASHINTEDGLWNTEDNHHRYTPEGKKHIAAQKKMLDFINTHQRRGSFVSSIAILQGRNDAWKCFVRNGSAWSQEGDEWKYGPAEYSFDLLNIFFPNSKLDAVYAFPCPKEKQGWYTGFPYGAVDIVPIEANETILKTYRAIALLGWNTFEEKDFVNLLAFVKNGGTLLFSRMHLNVELRHASPPKLPVSDALQELLGNNYASFSGIVKRDVGKGKIIYFAQQVYPFDSSIRKEYEKELSLMGMTMLDEERKKGWIKGNDEIQFTAYDWNNKNCRTIYILNTAWWKDELKASVKLLLDKREFDIDVRRNKIEVLTIADGIAVKPSSMYTDIQKIEKVDGKIFVKVQTTEADTLSIFSTLNTKQSIVIRKPGIHDLIVE